jgi:hypothetical protein
LLVRFSSTMFTSTLFDSMGNITLFENANLVQNIYAKKEITSVLKKRSSQPSTQLIMKMLI